MNEVMTAEDYLRHSEQENKRLFDIELLNIGEAYKALEMARQEEREKAVKALDIAIMAIFERNTHSVSMGELRVQFNKLLNE